MSANTWDTWDTTKSVTAPRLSPQADLADNVLKLFETNEYFDLVITCRDAKFKVHKALVCLGSEWFQRACKAGAWKEGQEAIVNLKTDETLPIPMDDPMLIRHMLQYIYGMDYLEEHEQGRIMKKTKRSLPWHDDTEEWITSSGHEAGDSSEPVPGSNARIHAQMCSVADFYDVPGLKTITRQKFGIALKNLRDVQHLAELLELVCNPKFQGDLELRSMMVDKIIRHDKLLDNPKIEAILLDNAEFTLALAKGMRAKA